jgi:UDP-N-acetylglucosamine 2-epimerase (non-hydrolysing)
MMARGGVVAGSSGVRFLEPFGFFDFVSLEQSALCVLSDSGTVQEETAIFGVPNVTIRDVTERPETIECGSNILAGCEPDAVLRAVRVALASPCQWTAPREYLISNVTETVLKIVLGVH